MDEQLVRIIENERDKLKKLNDSDYGNTLEMIKTLQNILNQYNKLNQSEKSSKNHLKLI